MPTIFGAPVSPFVRKVRAYMKERGLPYELKSVVPGGDDPEFRKASPLGKIPAFKDGDFTISDSSVIIAYLEHTANGKGLLSAEPKDAARALWFEEYADSKQFDVLVHKIFFARIAGPKFFNIPADETAIQKAIDQDLPPIFDYLEGQITGDYLVGGKFSLADIGVTTSFINLMYANVTVDAGRWPKLAKYLKAIMARPCFAECMAEEQAFMKQMAA